MRILAAGRHERDSVEKRGRISIDGDAKKEAEANLRKDVLGTTARLVRECLRPERARFREGDTSDFVNRVYDELDRFHAMDPVFEIDASDENSAKGKALTPEEHAKLARLNENFDYDLSFLLRRRRLGPSNAEFFRKLKNDFLADPSTKKRFSAYHKPNWEITLQAMPSPQKPEAYKAWLYCVETDLSKYERNSFENANFNAHKWEMNAVRVDRSVEVMAEFMRKNLWPGEDVLDLGCGTARLAEKLSGDEIHYVGVDTSPQMLEFGSKKDLPNVWFLDEVDVSQRERLIYPDEAFHHVAANSMINYLSEDELKITIAEMARVLKKDGYMYLSFEPLQSDRSIMIQEQRYSIPHLVEGVKHSMFRENTIQHILRCNGLLIEEIRRNVYVHHDLGQVPTEFTYMRARKGEYTD